MPGRKPTVRWRADVRNSAPERVVTPLALTASSLRAGGTECRRCREPVRQSIRNLGPADAPGVVGAIPPDLAPAIVQANDGIVGTSRGRSSKTDSQDGNSKSELFHRKPLPAPARNLHIMLVQTCGKSAKAGATNAKAAGTSPAASVERPLQGGNCAGAGNIEPVVRAASPDRHRCLHQTGRNDARAASHFARHVRRLVRRLGLHPAASRAP